jgi:hypothetical protein
MCSMVCMWGRLRGTFCLRLRAFLKRRYIYIYIYIYTRLDSVTPKIATNLFVFTKNCWPCKSLHRVIKKSLCTWWLQHRKLQVMSKVSPASLQTFIDTRLTLTPSVILNSNYVTMVSYWNCLKYICMFLCLYSKSSGAQKLFDHPFLSILGACKWIFLCRIKGGSDSKEC